MKSASWWIKYERAISHSNYLNNEVAEALATSPSALIRATDSGKTLEVRTYLIPRPHWAAIAGDAFHNMRSSLDHIAYGLVRAGPASPDRQTTFPVTRSRSTFQAEVKTKLPGVGPRALAVVEDLQPYGHNGLELAALHGLDIIDKHRELHIAAPLIGSVDPNTGYDSQLLIALDEPDLDLYGPVRNTFDFATPLLPLLKRLLSWTNRVLERLDPYSRTHASND